LGERAEVRKFVGDEVVAADDAAVVANADLDTAIVEVGDDGFEGLSGLLNSRQETVSRGLFGHGRDARGRRPKAPEAQGCLPGCRGQERP